MQLYLLLWLVYYINVTTIVTITIITTYYKNNIMKYTSKVNYANKNNTTLKAVIPSEIAESLDLTANDTIKWTIKKDEDSTTVTVEKLIL